MTIATGGGDHVARGPLTLGVDIGGTFTDLVLLDPRDGGIRLEKVLTTYPDPSVGVLDGVDRIVARADVAAKDVGLVVHGSTIGINAVLQRKGATVALIVTEGFRDVLEIARQTRPSLYDLTLRRLDPLVDRARRFEAAERVLADGSVARVLTLAEIDRVLDQVADSGADALAICLLHSYANPAHELAIEHAARRRFPGMFLTSSAVLVPEFREFERMSTAVVNSYIGPVTDAYIGELASAFSSRGIARFEVVQANGGILGPDRARSEPVRIIESGPAGGVIAAAHVGSSTSRSTVIAFDMGGTTAKASLVLDGKPVITNDYEVSALTSGDRIVPDSGYPIRMPVVDLVEVGAGGGSIAWIDSGGALRVGPSSAGSVPGPACYGRGGSAPTITDANVVLGRLGAASFLGGEMPLDEEAAYRAIDEHIARPLGIGVDEASLGIVRIANETMIRAIRLVSVERGHDPRRFSMVASGGAAGLHAGAIADALTLNDVLVPHAPGLFSALGFLWADPRADASRTRVVEAHAIQPAFVDALYRELEADVRGRLREDDAALAGTEITRIAEMRYRGQGYELAVLVRAPFDLAQALAGFHRAHEGAFGYSDKSAPVEFVTFRLVGSTRRPTPEISGPRVAEPGAVPRPLTHRRVVFDDGAHSCPVYARNDLLIGHVVIGPAIVEEPDTTIVVYPGWTASCDLHGNVVQTVAAAPGEHHAYEEEHAKDPIDVR
jgi:N-methylhydantoinase A